MDTRIPLVIALLGFGAPALAGDIDEIAPMAQSHDADTMEAGAQSRRTTRAHSNGDRKVMVSRTSNGNGQSVTHVRGTNGSRTFSATKASSSRTVGRGPAEATRTASRGRVTVSDGNGHVVSKSGASRQGSVSATGPRGGTVERSRSTGTVKTVAANRNTDRTVVTNRHVTSVPRAGTRSTTVVHANGPSAVRPGPVVRPGPTVVTRPGPRTVVVNGRPGPTTRVVRTPARTRTVVYRRVTPAHGVFVFGPPPTHHHHYVHTTGDVQVREAHLPDRAVDRADSLAVGVKAGTLVSGTLGGDTYGDLGLGLLGRYRPAEAVGLQLDLGHHAGRSTFDLNESQRSQTQVAGSVQLFAFPWTRVSPYAVGGVTWNARSLEDQLATGSATTVVETTDALWGLHGGLGVELAMGNNFALDLEGRYVGWLDRQEGDAPGAFQATAGLLFHFK